MRYSYVLAIIAFSVHQANALTAWLAERSKSKNEKFLDHVGKGLEEPQQPSVVVEKDDAGEFVMKRLRFKDTNTLRDFMQKNIGHAKFLPFPYMGKLNKYWAREIGILSDVAQLARSRDWMKEVEANVNDIIKYFKSLWTVGKWMSADKTRMKRIRAIEVLFAAFKFIREREDELVIRDGGIHDKVTILQVFEQMIKNAKALVVSETEPNFLHTYDWAALVYASGEMVIRKKTHTYTDPAREFGVAMMEMRAICDVELKSGCDEYFQSIATVVYNEGQADGISVSDARRFILAYHRTNLIQIADKTSFMQIIKWITQGAHQEDMPAVLSGCSAQTVEEDLEEQLEIEVDEHGLKEVRDPRELKDPNVDVEEEENELMPSAREAKKEKFRDTKREPLRKGSNGKSMTASPIMKGRRLAVTSRGATPNKQNGLEGRHGM